MNKYGNLNFVKGAIKPQLQKISLAKEKRLKKINLKGVL